MARVLRGRVGGRRFRPTPESSLSEDIEICERELRSRDDLLEVFGLRLVKVRRCSVEYFAVVSSSSELSAKLEICVFLRLLVRIYFLDEAFGPESSESGCSDSSPSNRASSELPLLS